MCPADSSTTTTKFDWTSIADDEYWGDVYGPFGFPANEKEARSAYRVDWRKENGLENFYQELGHTVDLLRSAAKRKDSDWAFATFSLTYPLAVSAASFLNNDETGTGVNGNTDRPSTGSSTQQPVFTTNLDRNYWNAGRFKGFSHFRFVAEGSVDRSQIEVENPKAFYQRGDYRYPQDFADTLDAWALQRLPCLTDKQSSSASEGQRTPSDVSGAATYGNCHASHLVLKQIEGLTEFHLGEPGEKGSAGEKPQGVLRLVALELIEYRRLVNPDTGGEPIDRFLNLHLVLEWPSSHVLDQVSKALHRPRNKIRLRPSSAQPLFANFAETKKLFGFDKKKDFSDGCDVELLPYFVDVIADHMLNEVITSPNDGLSGRYRITLGRGNAIRVKDRNPQSSGTQQPAADVARKLVPSAYRVVCAVPNSVNVSAPQLFLDLAEGSPQEVDKAHRDELLQIAWAWSLATGADRYYDDIPSATALLDQGRIDSYSRYWTISSDPSGMAFVRNRIERLGELPSEDSSPIDVASNPKIYMLVATQFLDLAILAIRVEIALSLMQAELDQDTLATDALNQSVDSGDVEKLAGVVNRLQSIHKLHLAFRRDLWFESIPGRPTDNVIMQSMLESRDNKAAYADFRAELDLHKEILEAAFKRQSDHKDQEEQKLKERQNLIIGIVALTLGIPAWVELFGFDFNLSTGGLTLFVAFVLFLIIVSGYRIGNAMKARQKLKNATKR